MAFDGELRAIYARADESAAWTLLAAQGRSTYARDRLGSMLGLSPRLIERLAAPERCGETFCAWTWRERTYVFVRDETAFTEACIAGAIVITRVPTPEAALTDCRVAALLDANDLASHGGGFIYDDETLRIGRARTGASRPWTPSGAAQE